MKILVIVLLAVAASSLKMKFKLGAEEQRCFYQILRNSAPTQSQAKSTPSKYILSRKAPTKWTSATNSLTNGFTQSIAQPK